jgi:hypothetical protein
MFRRNQPQPATAPYGPVRLDEPHDTCFRCGRPTPLGVSLCEQDNPGAIKSPSSTQVHGTIVIGVLAGFVLLAVLLRVATTGVGPFPASVIGTATRADGGLDMVIAVTNDGDRASGASCRTAAGGALNNRETVFFTDPIPPGETLSFSQTLLAGANGQPLNPASLVVRCN